MHPQRNLPGPYLFAHGDYLSLHLGNSTTDGVHATMDRTAPDHLVFSYTQIMAGFFRFQPTPHRIGLLGLGGGSLAKYCFRRFPEARITVAEISPDVIALRRSFFIPDDGERFSVVHTDGVAFVQGSRCAFDVLLVDAFDESGHLPRFGTRAFYRSCFRALTDRGVLVLNFSGEAWQSCLPRLSRTFGKRIVLYHCPDGDNVIAFATRCPLPQWIGDAGATHAPCQAGLSPAHLSEISSCSAPEQNRGQL